jgi:hypothetical protein
MGNPRASRAIYTTPVSPPQGWQTGQGLSEGPALCCYRAWPNEVSNRSMLVPYAARILSPAV